MCWSVYIATFAPLRDVRFTKANPPGEPPLLHFQEIAPDPELRDNLCRPLFKAPYLYHVGSTSGCSCHLSASCTTEWGDNNITYEWYPSCAVFLDFIQRYTQHKSLEMYVVWEDAWDSGLAATPAEYVEIDASTLSMHTYFGLVSRRFYHFTAWGASPSPPDAPRFLNVDLDIESPIDLRPLLEHWKDTLLVLTGPADTGPNLARLECTEQPADPTEAISRFCEAVEALPPDLAERWRRCAVRRLDIGYESGAGAPYHCDELPAELLRRVAERFTGLGVVVYGG